MKSISEKQLAANRANAARSTGPRTPEGKLRASRNSRKHGLADAAVSILRLEDRGELDNLRADALARYRPRDSQEMFAVERIAMCQLMMIRGWRLEAGMFITCLNRVLNDDDTPIFGIHESLFPDAGIRVEQNRNSAMAEGFQRMAIQSPMWSLVIRYQAQVERQYRRAIEDFQRLIRERKNSPNEPDSDPQPQETEPQSAPADEPIPEPGAGVHPLPVSGRYDRPSPAPNVPASEPSGTDPNAVRRRDPGRACAGSSSAVRWRSGRSRVRTRSNGRPVRWRSESTSRSQAGQPEGCGERPLTRPFYLDVTSAAVPTAAAPVIIPLSSSNRVSYA
jgi:hypothetical protein